MGNPLILMYHRVIPAAQTETLPEPGIWVDTRDFERQISCLKKKCDIVPLSDLVKSLRQPEKRSRRLCSITFDDGWLDCYLYALPVIEHHGVSACVFVATGSIQDGRRFWTGDAWNALNSLKNDCDVPNWLPRDLEWGITRLMQARSSSHRECLARDCMEILKSFSQKYRNEVVAYLLENSTAPVEVRTFLNWDEILEMRGKGIEFGAHTRSHPILPPLRRGEMKNEIEGSKADLEDALGEPVSGFAYPNGDWDERAREVVAEAGFSFACTTRHAHCAADEDLYALPRIGVHDGVSKLFGSFSETAFGLRLGLL